MKKNLFKTAFLIAVITFSAQYSFAQTTAAAQKEKFVDELVSATLAAFPTSTVEQMVKSLVVNGGQDLETQITNLINEKLNESNEMPAAKKAEVREKIPAFTAKLSARFKTILNEGLEMRLWIADSLKANYNRQFTTAELRRLNAFFKSPSGQDFTNLVMEIAAAEAEKRPPQTDGIVSKKSELQIEKFMKTPLADKFIGKFTEDADGILVKRVDEWGDKMLEKVKQDMENGEMNKILMDFMLENFS